MKLFLPILLMTLTSLHALATSKITFKNGDILTGTIENKTEKKLQLKTNHLGTLTIPIQQISVIDSMSNKAAPKPTSPKPHKKPASPITPDRTKKTPDAPPQTKRPLISFVKVEDAQIQPLMPEPKNEKEKGKWSGKAEASLALQERNNINEKGESSNLQQFQFYSLFGQLNYEKGKNTFKWSSRYRYRESDVRLIDDYFNVTQDYKNKLSQTYYASAKTMYQQDYAREINNEFLQSAQIGVSWFDSKKFKLSTSAGGAYHEFERLENSRRRSSNGEGKFIFDQSMRWQVIDTLAITEKITHLGDFQRYRFVFTGGIENKLIYDLFFRLEYKLDRDTDTFYDNRGYYDKKLVTSLFYKF